MATGVLEPYPIGVNLVGKLGSGAGSDVVKRRWCYAVVGNSSGGRPARVSVLFTQNDRLGSDIDVDSLRGRSLVLSQILSILPRVRDWPRRHDCTWQMDTLNTNTKGRVQRWYNIFP